VQGLVIDQGSARRVVLRRCRFRNFPLTALVTRFIGCSDFIVEKCIFEGPGNATGRMIFIDTGCRNFKIRNNVFRYYSDAIIIDTGSTTGTEEIVTENGEISGNHFDGGWWLLTSRFAGSGAGVTYTSTVLTDTGAAFSGLGSLDTVRIMPVLRTGTFAVGAAWRLIQDASATFVTAGVKRGHIVRTGSAFAVVSNVESETKLWVEEWLSDTDRYPIAPPASGTYTVYGIYIGRVASSTGTTITVGSWLDLDGAAVTPTAGTRYEVMATHPNYPLNGESSSRDIRVINNRFLRGWSDQISCFGYRWTISDNHVESGQDMGITIQGGFAHKVTNNTVRHQGASSIAIHATDCIISNNALGRSCWVNPDPQLGDIWLLGGSRNIISNNQFDVDGAVNDKKGIAAISSADGNRITGNKFRGHVTAGIYLDQATVTSTVLRDNEITGTGVGPVYTIVSAVGTDIGLLTGTSAPEGVVTAPAGQLYRQLDAMGGTFWRKAFGTDGRGWVRDSDLYEYAQLMNRFPNSESYSNLNALTVTAGQSDPWGTTRASLLTVTGLSAFVYDTAATSGQGATPTASIWAKAGTLTDLRFQLYNVTDSAVVENTDFTVDSTWRRYRRTYTGLNPAKQYRVFFCPGRLLVSSGTMTVTGHQFSDTDTPYLPTTGTAVTTATSPLRRWETEIQAALGLVLGVTKFRMGAAAPASGTWAVGDRVFNSAPVAGGTEGWVCVTAGTPGTWKTFGTIAA
jgi:hypothetical protein